MSGLQEQNTAMHLAAQHGHPEVLQKIMETGVDVDERNIVSEPDPSAYLIRGTVVHNWQPVYIFFILLLHFTLSFFSCASHKKTIYCKLH